jgi:microcystin degradation protein MlrC
MAKPKRIAIARLWHEGNSFSPAMTTLADFRRREWVAGEDARRFYADSATELGAAVAFAGARPDYQISFLRCAAAPPAGPVIEADFQRIRDEIVSGLAGGGWDGVYLSLHGALVTEARPTADLDFLTQVRATIGVTPLAISFDLHANLGQPLLDLADIVVGYKTYPHIDMVDTGRRTLELLAQTLDRGTKLTIALRKLPAILPSFNMRTTDGPMTEIAALARQWEQQPGVLDATVFGGFAYGDTPHAGPTVVVSTAGDAALAVRAADDLLAALAARRDRFYVSLPDPATGLAQALAAPPGTAAVLDPSDNPLSGGIGDTPGLFRALMEARPSVPTVFAFFHDPAAVAGAHEAGVGGRLALQLGARLTTDYGPSVAFAGRVTRLTDGRFRNEGPMEANLPVQLGRTAVIADGSITVIVSESCQAPNDPAYFALHGIDLSQVRLLCVKAKNHFRAAFAPHLAAIVEIDAPGPASPDLRQYPFRHVPPGIYPLDARQPER